MRIIFAYISHRLDAHHWYRAICRHAPDSIDVVPFCISLPDTPGRISWRELDARWQSRDASLLLLYNELAKVVSEADVLWNYNGSMLHPRYLGSLPIYKVISCFDDPEDYPDLIRPIANSYDLFLYGNIASEPLFRSISPNSYWLPIFNNAYSQASLGQPRISDDVNKDIDIVFIGGIDGFSDYRRNRLLKLKAHFPQALCIGRGWESGFDPELDIPGIYARSRIGWNIHRTVGPVNERTFDLAYHGVAQICDNHFFLGRIFEPAEALGFSTIAEAVEATSYLLSHPTVCSRLAQQARRRYLEDYSCQAIWSKALMIIESNQANREPRRYSFKAPSPSLLPFKFTRKWHKLLAYAKSASPWSKQELFSINPYSYQTYSFSDVLYIDGPSTARQSDTAFHADIPQYVTAGLLNILPSDAVCHVCSRDLKAVRYIPRCWPHHQGLVHPCFILLAATQAFHYLSEYPALILSARSIILLAPALSLIVHNLAFCSSGLSTLGASPNLGSFFYFPQPDVPWLEPFSIDAPPTSGHWFGVVVNLDSGYESSHAEPLTK